MENVKNFFIVKSDVKDMKALISFKQHQTIYFSLLDINTGINQHYNFSLSCTDFYKMSVSGDRFFTILKKSSIHIARLDNFKDIAYYSAGKYKLTCIASHHEEDILLTGDSHGRVILWQNLFSKKPTKTIFHWHTLPVNYVTFSDAGTHFFSGADECVLVRWQMDNYLEKKFLPRLASPIQNISVSQNNIYIAIATKDNAIRIVDSRFSQISLIQNLVVGDQFESGIVLDHRTKSLIMNGNVGQVQFYSTHEESLLYHVSCILF